MLELGAACVVVAAGGGHVGEFGGGAGHAEQADREQVQGLGVGEGSDHALAEVADDDLVDVTGELRGAAAPKGGWEGGEGGADAGGLEGQGRAYAAHEAEDAGELNQELEGGAG